MTEKQLSMIAGHLLAIWICVFSSMIYGCDQNRILREIRDTLKTEQAQPE